MAKKQRLPKLFQGFFWSTDYRKLDINKDKTHIIHQLFEHGTLEEIKWLFSTYSRDTLRNVFINKPSKNYHEKTYCLVKNILLDLKDTKLNKNYYVINTPRIIRH